MAITRREFIGSAAAISAFGQQGPKRIAVVTTIYRYLSHAQHMVDRFLIGYPHEGAWHKPDMKVVSLYVDQKPEGDQSAARAREFGFQVYPTIAEALRCGGNKLAVDAVLIIGEHGDYPRNEKGRCSTRATNSSSNALTFLRKTAAWFPSTTISIFPIASRKRRRWWPPRSA